MYVFRWNDWNLDKVAKHNVSPDDAEYVVRNARRPYPRCVDDEKVLVRGQAEAGHYLQVIYLLEADDVVFVIHARPLNLSEKRNLRRSRK